MSSHSEKGHAKNVANFETEISFCTAYGTAYNPSKQSITITALNELLQQSRTALNEVTREKNTYDLAVNERKIVFSTLKPTATRLINALDVTDASYETVADAKSINKKIQGGRTSAKPSEDEDKKTISTSQQSYDSLVENFSKLLDLIALEPSYAPNEEELRIDTLNQYVEKLRSTNLIVIETYTVYSNSMISRDNVMYAEKSGMVNTALEVKKYVKSVFGATSPQFKQVSKLEFSRPR
ncbi:MAG: hypothetical protein LBP67_05375 [Bacteroidales bacterium]|jgi:hypothetical protein|nr:hypothetical protein [Bacteroidales bacterium]